MNAIHCWRTAMGILLLGVLVGCGPAPTPGTRECHEEAAVADLAQALAISPDSIRLVSSEPVEWPDASLGCPEPGKSYAQVVTPGCRLTLEAGGQRYDYHTGGSTVIRCLQGGQPPSQPTLEPTLAKLVEQAKRDLSGRTGQHVASISLESAEAVEWRDSSLGCPEPGKAYLEVITPGYRIVLLAEGKKFEYHSDLDRAIYCQNPQPPAP